MADMPVPGAGAGRAFCFFLSYFTQIIKYEVIFVNYIFVIPFIIKLMLFYEQMNNELCQGFRVLRTVL